MRRLWIALGIAAACSGCTGLEAGAVKVIPTTHLHPDAVGHVAPGAVQLHPDAVAHEMLKVEPDAVHIEAGAMAEGAFAPVFSVEPEAVTVDIEIDTRPLGVALTSIGDIVGQVAYDVGRDIAASADARARDYLLPLWGMVAAVAAVGGCLCLLALWGVAAYRMDKRSESCLQDAQRAELA